MNLIWWAMGDSNPRLSPRQDDTLPTELIAHKIYTFILSDKKQNVNIKINLK